MLGKYVDQRVTIDVLNYKKKSKCARFRQQTYKQELKLATNMSLIQCNFCMSFILMQTVRSVPVLANRAVLNAAHLAAAAPTLKNCLALMAEYDLLAACLLIVVGCGRVDGLRCCRTLLAQRYVLGRPCRWRCGSENGVWLFIHRAFNPTIVRTVEDFT